MKQQYTIEDFESALESIILHEEEELYIDCAYFAYSFFIDGIINPEFVRLMKLLSKREGWFTPASTVLTPCKNKRGESEI